MRTIGLALVLGLAATLSLAQDQDVDKADAAPGAKMSGMDHQDHQMPGMDMSEMGMGRASGSLVDSVVQHATAGTDAEPNSTAYPMLMTQKARWTLMLHGVAFLNEIQQSGPRGRDKLFSTNWIMPMAQSKLGTKGTLTLRTMISLEPATISSRRYPELFEQGETAYRHPIVDGQHPHDFFMEVALLYDFKLGENTMLSLYAAPTGDPALGPSAYPHRSSSSENPLAPLGHHLEDSTHISSDVVTIGITHRNLRLEASGFHGREPDEYRWDIDSGKIDSWSVRTTFNPAQNWSFQYSISQLHSPEELNPSDDIRRMTASLMYNRPLHNGNWASTLVWGRNQSLEDGNVGNAYLFESTLRFLGRNYGWTRIENVDRTNELLLGETPLPSTFVQHYITRVQAYSLGYDRELGQWPLLSTALGAQLTMYGVPRILSGVYGSHPAGVLVFLRLRTR